MSGRSAHVPATRNPREDQALLLRKPPSSAEQGIIRCRAGVGGQGSRAAMESPQALMCRLEKGD